MDVGWTDTDIDISIEDDGPGFSASILGKFGQPWNSSREGVSGHKGLGLFLAKTLIETIGGQMTASNAEQSGAIVHIQIPLDGL
jgi:two-component system sensor histidine kinase RegB